MSTDYAKLIQFGMEYLPQAIETVREMRPRAATTVTVEVIAMETRNVAELVRAHNRFNPIPRDGYRFVLATLRITNWTPEPVSPGKWSHMIHPVDNMGRRYEAVGMDLPDNATGAPMIGTGISGVYFQTFEVLNAAEDLTWER